MFFYRVEGIGNRKSGKRRSISGFRFLIDKGQKDKYNEEKSNCQGSADKMRSPRCAKMGG